MADKFGLKIGVEGEKEFKNALRDINQSFKVLGSEMKLVSSQFDKQDKSVEAITARNKVLNKEIDAQKDKISTLEKALANASSSFGENDKRTQAWAIQLNNAKAELNGMERELKSNEKALDGVADEFNEAEKQADQFGNEVKKTADTADDAGGKFEKLGGVLKGIGVALGAAMAAIGTAAVTAGKKLYDMATSAAASADNIDKQSQRLGMSKQAFQEWDYILSQNGVSIDTMNTAMKSMTAAMADLDKGGKKGEETLAKLGVTTADLKNLKQEEIFEKAVVALQKMPEGYEKARLAQQLFGKQGQEMLPMLNQSKGSIEELKAKAHELGLVMSDEAVNAGVKFTDSMDTLKRSFNGVKNSIGAEMLPGLTVVTDALTGLITGQEGAGEKLREGAKAIVESVSDMIPRILDIVFSIISAIAEVAPDILGALVKGIVDNLPSLINAAVSIIKTLLTALIDALPEITKGALQLVLALVDGIIANLPQLVEAALTMIVTLATGIGEALPELIPSIIEAILLIVEVLLNNMDKILEAAFAIIEGLAMGLINALPKLIEALPRIIESIITFITNNLPLIIEMGIKLIVQLAFGLIQAIPQLVASLPQIIAAIIGGLGKAIGSVTQIGIDIVKGLWEGIKSMGKWLSDAVGNFFGGIVSGIKGLLGIHSPSTVFAGIGGNMGEGIGIGFLNAMNDVERDMQRAIPTEFDVNASVSGTGNSRTVNHTGVIRVEGVNSRDELTSVVDIVIDQLRGEVRI